VVSPGDSTPFKVETVFGALGVEEVLLANPAEKHLQLLRRTDDGYVETDRSEVPDVAIRDLTNAIDWPED